MKRLALIIVCVVGVTTLLGYLHLLRHAQCAPAELQGLPSGDIQKAIQTGDY